MKTYTIIKTTALILALITVSITTAAAISCDCGDICVNETGWWRDGGEFNASGAPIQAAVDNASSGDTICVKDGSYNENVDVTTDHLTIQSENGAVSMIVQAANSDDHIFEVTANYVNISGLNVAGATGTSNAGICLNGVDHCNISDNTASGNYDGIDLYDSSDNMLTGNTANSNYCDGIYLEFSSDNRLLNNAASNNHYPGIYLWGSNNNTLENNTANSNQDYSDGIYLDSSSDNTLTGNTASNNDGDGIELYDSNDNLIYNNYLDNTYNVYDDGSNQWNTTVTTGPNIIGGPSIGGNYWSDYAGADPDGDGFGNTPYNIAGGSNQDHLPLVPVTCTCGDVDGNGIVNIMDVRLLMNHVANPPGYPVALDAGDLDSDGDIDGDDVGLLLNRIFNPPT